MPTPQEMNKAGFAPVVMSNQAFADYVKALDALSAEHFIGTVWSNKSQTVAVVVWDDEVQKHVTYIKPPFTPMMALKMLAKDRTTVFGWTVDWFDDAPQGTPAEHWPNPSPRAWFGEPDGELEFICSGDFGDEITEQTFWVPCS